MHKTLVGAQPLYSTWLLILAFFLLAACAPTVQQQESYVFGTRVEVLVVDNDSGKAKKALALVLAEFDRLHQEYHPVQPSALSSLNAAIAAGKPYQVKPELLQLIEDAQRVSAQTQGLFDPGIGQLIARWGFQDEEFHTQPPAASEMAAWRQQAASIRQLLLSKNGTVTSTNRHVALDFGGYLKGVALDHARDILHAQGIRHALINIGGNVMALGNKSATADGTPWRVGIKHPRQSGPIATLALHDGEAIGTSGDYQRYFIYQGQRYCHILDPRTGEPGIHTASLSLVITPSEQHDTTVGMRSDALSKPLFLSDAGHWQEMAHSLGTNQVLRIDTNGRIEVSAALLPRLEWVGEKPDFFIIK